MKKIISLLLTIAMAISLFAFPASAAASKTKYAPKPELRIVHGEGCTAVQITKDFDADIRYTIDGTKPTAKSPKTKYVFEFEKKTSLRFRVSKKGYKTAVYTFKIDVNPWLENKVIEGSDFEKAINSIKLKPITAPFEAEDETLQEIVAEATEGCKTNCEKLIGIYDWITVNVRYYCDVVWQRTIPKDQYGIKYKTDAWLLQRAIESVGEKAWPADEHLPALFVTLCRVAGIPANYVKGINNRNPETELGYRNHAWASITINGVAYYFDPAYDSSRTYNLRYENISDVPSNLYFAMTDISATYKIETTEKFHNFELSD